MPIVRKRRPLRQGGLHNARLAGPDASQRLSGPNSHFVALLRLLFDAGMSIRRDRDLNALKDYTKYFVALVRAQPTDDWIFELFTPSSASCMCINLADAPTRYPRLARCNQRLASLVRQAAPQCVDSACIYTAPQHHGALVVQPMSNARRASAHFSILLADKGGQ